MEMITLKLTGKSPLMMHSDTLADPIAAVTKAHKELTGKRKKTEEDHLAIARSEYIAGLHYTQKDGVYIPGDALDLTLWNGAKLQKLGVHWKRGALLLETKIKLLYDGPQSPAELWEDVAFRDVRAVRVGTAKVMRYRPVFLKWAAVCTVGINTAVLNLEEAKKAISDAGALIGLLECRPRFGRFEVAYG